MGLTVASDTGSDVVGRRRRDANHGIIEPGAVNGKLMDL
jgi:hypothetical protein